MPLSLRSTICTSLILGSSRNSFACVTANLVFSTPDSPPPPGSDNTVIFPAGPAWNTVPSGNPLSSPVLAICRAPALGMGTTGACAICWPPGPNLCCPGPRVNPGCGCCCCNIACKANCPTNGLVNARGSICPPPCICWPNSPNC